jgi:uncharacterized protein YecE (DUF72 family)
MIRIGTSGFSYDDWHGSFYPESLKPGDRLAFYAQHFSTVEINTTYYRQPDPGLFYHFVRRTPDDFCFVVKAYRGLTHEREEATPEAFRQFVEALAPLQQAGKFGCLLAQFPWSFQPTAANRAYLEYLRGQLGDLPVVVEFRHAGWVTDETLDLLRHLGLGFCCVDEPRLRGLLPPVAAVTAPTAYVRFHGRNAAKWWTHDEAWERYNYLYSESELAEWTPRIRSLAAQADTTYVIFNNHYRSQAVRNAQQMAQQLELDLP